MYDIQGVYFSPPDRKAKVNFFCGHPVHTYVSQFNENIHFSLIYNVDSLSLRALLQSRENLM